MRRYLLILLLYPAIVRGQSDSSVAKVPFGAATAVTSYTDLKLNKSDTGSMLDAYKVSINGKASTASVALKVNISDTSAMLTNYRNGLNSGIAGTALKIAYTDTSGMLTEYRNRLNAGVVTAGLKVAYTDTSAMLTEYRNRLNSGVVNNALKVNISDTSGMLTNYRNGLNSIIATKVNISDTSAMLTNYRNGLNALIVVDATKAPLASPTFTGTVSGVTATMVGLGNVTNESKATMFTSPTFTGTPTGIGIPVYARVTGSNVTTTGQSLVDIAGLSVSLTTNATYEFEATLSVSTTAVTTGTQYGVNYSVAGGAVEAGINGPLTSTAAKTERISALNTATSAYLTTSAQTGQVVIKGIVTTGANAGNLTVKHLKVTSGTSTVFINSYLKVTRIN